MRSTPLDSFRWIPLLYFIHRWCGALFGWLLFIICLTGTLAVFKHPLKVWANPTLISTPAADHYGPDKALSIFRTTYPEMQPTLLAFPVDAYSVHLYSYAFRRPSGEATRAWLNPATGRLIEPLPSDLSDFIQRLHAGLWMGRTGRWIVGALGLLMALGLLSGLALHWRRLKRDLFLQPLLHAGRRRWSDIHKLTGTWLLFMHLLLALTGAWLGLESLLRTPGPHPLAMTGEKPDSHAEMASITRLLTAAQEAQRETQPEFTPTHIRFDGFGAAGSTVRVQGDLPGSSLVQRGQTMVVLDAESAVPRQTIDRTREGWARRILAAMRPLHYGYFGGIWSKLFYFFVGIGSCLLLFSGLSIWAARTKAQSGARHRPVPATDRGNAIERGNVAIMGGLMLTLALFALLNALAQITLPENWLAFLQDFPLSPLRLRSLDHPVTHSHSLPDETWFSRQLSAFIFTWLMIGGLLAACPIRTAWPAMLLGLSLSLAALPFASAQAAGGFLSDWQRGNGEAAGIAAGSWFLALLSALALRRYQLEKVVTSRRQ